MDVFVGTSGWSYSWNRGGTLDWYVGSSSLNAVELNASFYRFPFRNMVTGWARRGGKIRWCVKVHRSVTHLHRFNETARSAWDRFLDRFAPLDPCIDWYLFQAPPSMKDTGRIDGFFNGLPGAEKCVLELRNKSLLLDDAACRRLQERLPLVSVDSPDAENRIFDGETVYLRMHGRGDWYRYDYPAGELKETADRIRRTGAQNVYVFFNNDHSMLSNARRMLGLLNDKPYGME